MTAGALKRACHHVCKQPRSAPLNPQTWLYGVSSRMGGERRAGCQERAGAGVAQSGGCHIRGQHIQEMPKKCHKCKSILLFSKQKSPSVRGIRPRGQARVGEEARRSSSNDGRYPARCPGRRRLSFEEGPYSPGI